MDDFSLRVRRVTQICLYVLSASFLGWAFTPSKTLFAGLIMGTSVSLINAIFTSHKINRLAEVALSGQGKGGSTGTGFRFGTSVLAAIIAIRYPEVFDLIFTVIGLMVAQLIAFLDGGFHLLKSTIDRSRKG